MKKLFWYDTETSGIDYKNQQILSIAIVCTDEKYNLLDELYVEVKLKAGIIPDQKALEINKINPYTLMWAATSVEEVEMLEKVIIFYNKNKSENGKDFWLAYNAQFDNNFINESFSNNSKSLDMDNAICIDPLLFIRELVKNKTLNTKQKYGQYGYYNSSKLEDVAEFLNIQYEGEAHNSLSDVHVMIKVLNKITSRYIGNEEGWLEELTQKYSVSF